MKLQVQGKSASLDSELTGRPSAGKIRTSHALRVANGVPPERTDRETAASPDANLIYVIGAEIGDVVDSVGGWMCDMAMAGWHVHVATLQADDVRPLQILGGRPQVADTMPRSLAGTEPAVVAVCARVFADNPKLQKSVLAARGDWDLIFWGQADIGAFGEALTPVSYQPSTLAKAFKHHASAAVERPPAAQDASACEEVFRTTADAACFTRGDGWVPFRTTPSRRTRV